MSRSFAMNVLAVSRAYSIPYIGLAGLAAMLLGPDPISVWEALLCAAIPALLTVGLAALNDAVHARADARAGRGRDYPPRLLAALGTGGTLGAFTLAALGGPWPLAGVAGAVVGGMAYALAKSQPGLANIVRGATSVPLVLGLGALNATPFAAALPLALGVGLLDGAGNIWGDVRDAEADRQAGVRTIVVVAPRLATALALGLHVAALALLALAHGALWLTLLGSAWTLAVAPHWQHRAFLVVKYVTLIWLAVALSVAPSELGLVAAFGAGGLPAWWLYTAIHRPRWRSVWASSSDPSALRG